MGVGKYEAADTPNHWGNLMLLPAAILFGVLVSHPAGTVAVNSKAAESAETMTDQTTTNRAKVLLELSGGIFRESKADLTEDVQKTFRTFITNLAKRIDTDAQMQQSQIFIARVCQRMVDRGSEANGRIKVGDGQFTDAMSGLCPFYPLCFQILSR